MKNPFRVLGLPEECDDQMVKSAYLQMVKLYPPEQHPARFQEARSAFEAIKTQRDRVAFHLFHPPQTDISQLFETVFTTATPGIPAKSDLLKFFNDSLDEYRLSIKP